MHTAKPMSPDGSGLSQPLQQAEASSLAARWANASLVAGCSVFLPFMAGIAAIVMGLVAILGYRAASAAKARARARVGIGLGVFSLLLWSAVGLVVVARFHERVRRAPCAWQLDELGKSLDRYATAYGHFPPDLATLVDAQGLIPDMARSPSHGSGQVPLRSDQDMNDSSYIYGGAAAAASHSADTIVLRDPMGAHPGGFHALHGDRTVRWHQRED